MNKIYQFFTSEKFEKRVKALLWSSATMLLAGLLDLISQGLLEVDPDNIITVCVGLVFAQITKQLNSKQ